MYFKLLWTFCLLNYVLISTISSTIVLDSCLKNVFEMSGDCMKKHRFFCINNDDLRRCNILNKTFDCETGQFCPNPIEAIEIGLSLQNDSERVFDAIELNANSAEDNGTLNIPSSFFDKFLNKATEFELRYLNMTNLPTFRHRNSLKKITVKENTIDELGERAFYNLTNLHLLELSYNNLRYIAELTFDTLISLEELDLANNQLMSIPNRAFNNLPKLERLFLSDNQLHTIAPNAFSIANRLRVLELSANKFEHLFTTQNLDALQFLYLNSNHLRSLECDRINASSQLMTIELEDNRINRIECDLNQFRELYVISLKGNQLTNLRKSIFFDYLESSRNLIIKGNSICKSFKKSIIIFYFLLHSKKNDVKRTLCYFYCFRIIDLIDL